MNVHVKNYGLAFGHTGYGAQAVSVDVGLSRSVVELWPSTEPAAGNVLKYDADVTQASLAAVQANSDRFRGDHVWEIVEDDDNLAAER